LAALYRADTEEAVRAGWRDAAAALAVAQQKLLAVRESQKQLTALTEYLAAAALTQFPLAELRAEFAACWEEELNPVQRRMRFMGKKTGAAVGAVISLITRLGRKPERDLAPSAAEVAAQKFMEECADLRQGLLDGELKLTTKMLTQDPQALGYQKMALPEIYAGCRERLATQKFATAIPELQAAWEQARHLPPDFREVIRPWVKAARAQMTSRDNLNEYFKSTLALAAPVVAVSYVVGSGGAAMVFGGSDIFALLALPAMLGIEKLPEASQRRAVTAMVKKWNDAQAPLLQRAIIRTLVGDFMTTGATVLPPVTAAIARAEQALAAVDEIFLAREKSAVASAAP
jgi:hypothetical protein